MTADEREIDTHLLGFTISPHEECAVEEAVRLIEAHGVEDDVFVSMNTAGKALGVSGAFVAGGALVMAGVLLTERG